MSIIWFSHCPYAKPMKPLRPREVQETSYHEHCHNTKTMYHLQEIQTLSRLHNNKPDKLKNKIKFGREGKIATI